MPGEACHAAIPTLPATARSFHNFDRYRTRIIFFLGKFISSHATAARAYFLASSNFTVSKYCSDCGS